MTPLLAVVVACGGTPLSEPVEPSPTVEETPESTPPATPESPESTAPEVELSAEDEEFLDEIGGRHPNDYLTWDEYLAAIASLRGIDDPPEVEVVREVHADEASEVIAECLREQGFDASVVPEGGLAIEYHAAQAEAVDLANYVCEAQYPLMPEFYRPFDVETLKRVYAFFEEDVLGCVRESGYDADLATWEQFLFRYQTTRALGSDFSDLPDAILTECYGSIPAEVILGE